MILTPLVFPGQGHGVLMLEGKEVELRLIYTSDFRSRFRIRLVHLFVIDFNMHKYNRFLTCVLYFKHNTIIKSDLGTTKCDQMHSNESYELGHP